MSIEKEMKVTCKEGIVGENVVHEIGHGVSAEELFEDFFGVSEGETAHAAETESERGGKSEIIETERTGVIVVMIPMVVVVLSAPARIDQTLFAVLIVQFPLLFVAQHFVGFRQFAKSYRRILLIVRIFIRVPTKRQFPIPVSNNMDQ